LAPEEALPAQKGARLGLAGTEFALVRAGLLGPARTELVRSGAGLDLVGERFGGLVLAPAVVPWCLHLSSRFLQLPTQLDNREMVVVGMRRRSFVGWLAVQRFIYQLAEKHVCGVKCGDCSVDLTKRDKAYITNHVCKL